MNVCILDNSHIAALKVALRDGWFSDPQLTFTFWGVRGLQFFDVKFESGRLVSPDAEFAKHISGGRHETIDPNEFDALVFHGPPLNPTALLRRLRKSVDSLSAYSVALLQAGIESYLDDRNPIKLIKCVRAPYAGRIVVSPQPLISETSSEFDNKTLNDAERVVLDSAVCDYFARIGVHYLPQPQHTIVDNQYTAARYSTGSVALAGDLDVEHPSDEHKHMNGRYGAEVLSAISLALRVKEDGNGLPSGTK